MRHETKFAKIARLTHHKCEQFEIYEVHRVLYDLVDTLIINDLIDEFNKTVIARRQEIIEELQEEKANAI